MREWLKKIREELNMTHEQVAKEAGISRAYYTRIENGNYKLPQMTAKAIADVLGFNWIRFYEDKNIV